MTRIQGSGGGGCFLGHTPITTPDGDRFIDSLKVGDIVVSFDDRGNLHEAKVLAVHIHKNEPVNRYHIWGGTAIDATPNHWVLNQFNAFVEIGTLGADDCLVDTNQHLRPIVRVEPLTPGTVYNLTVEGFHTFIAAGICVHNAGLGAGRIIGAGGGGGKGRGGTTTATDNISSSAYVRLIDLIGEGEMEGFPSARAYLKNSDEYVTASKKDIYLNGTPILRASADPLNVTDADFNFRNILLTGRFGTQNQTPIAGFNAVENETSVGIVVEKAAPVTREITNDQIDAVRVTLSWSALQEFTDAGDIIGRDVNYQIAVAYSGSAYVTAVDQTVTGRSGDPFQKSHVVPINGAFPIQIRVIRVTDDANNTKIQDTFSWYSYTELTYANLAYPNSALVAIQASAEDFNSIPSRSYRVRGIKIRIPSNATVDDDTGRLIYAGTWDGIFQAATWCSDPVWCLWDLLTSCRYGLGQHIHSSDLNKWAFYEASVYCNELVSDGRGGQEARFSCNVSIQNSQEAYKVINDMCSVFRAMPYWGAGTLLFSQDRPSDPIYLFNQTNVSEEGFQYSASSLRARHTVAVVGYLDLTRQEQGYESIEDPEGISRYGVITAEVQAFACTSRSQANRLGRWLLYAEQQETETVTFKAPLDGGIVVRPGHVIGVSDPLRSGVRRGGRTVSGTLTTVVADDTTNTDLPVTGSPYISTVLVDGTIETRNVSSISGRTINVSSAFSAVPLAGGAFIYANDDMQPSYWRVLSVQEQDGTAYSITAISYNSSKYNYVESGAPLETEIFAPIDTSPPTAPVSISATSVI
jgi:predicted phage tail protein